MNIDSPAPDQHVRDIQSDGSSARQSERIERTLIGQDDGTDPFVAAVRATRMPMIITNPRMPDNPVVFVNNAFCRLTGYDRDEIVGYNCRFLQGPETDPATIDRLRTAVRTEVPIEIDVRNHKKTGERFWNRLFLAPVYDAEHRLTYFFASQMDVTIERERMAGLESDNAALTAELAGRLREQQERESELRFALEAGRLGSWTLDVRSHELVTSPSCRSSFGRDPAAPFSSDDLRRSVHPDGRPRVEAALAMSVATGRDFDIECRLAMPDESTRWVSLRARPIRGPDGAVIRLSGVSQNITEQKRADRLRQALIDLGAVFRDVETTADLSHAVGKVLGEALEVSRAGYGTIDTVAEVITVERDWTAPGIRTIAGSLRFRDHGSYIDDLKRGETVVVTDADTDPRTASSASTLRAISARAFINMPVTEQGGLVALLYVNHEHARVWHDDERAFVWEVAHRTRAAVERRRAEVSLADLAASLEQQVAQRGRDLMATEEALRQSQKMEAIGQLTGGVAHDFNNLLTVIRSSVDLMRRPNLSEERRRRYIDAISDTVGRAARLTGQLLAFARRQTLKPEVFDVGARLAAIADMLDTVTGSRIRVVVEQPGQPCFVRADVSQFETALVNMAVNARDAMDGAGTLTLRVIHADAMPPIRGHGGAAGRFAAVAMADTGEGIAQDQIERIFEPFYTTKDVGKGTGLGLSQVFGFAKQSGGDVSVESAPGQGAVFTLYLPEIDAPACPDAEGDPARASHTMNGAGRRVLVVEDNVEVGRFSTQLLEDLGYETTWAANADEAIATLNGTGQPFDVVFSDVVMPGRSGIELAKEIRARYPGLPVVLTSGYSHVLAAEGSPGFELLHKPYSAEQLSKALRRASSGTRGARGRA